MAISSDSDLHRVYCAGPLFNRTEREEMTAIADTLCDAGSLVYLPHRDGMEFRLVLEVLVERGWSRDQAGRFLHAAIFALDVYQLVAECDAVVWNLNGRTPDEGAVSEAAIAWTLGKPLVAYSDDARSLIQGRINPLLAGMVEFETVDRIEKIPAVLAESFQRHEANLSSTTNLSPKLRLAVEDGRSLWKALTTGNTQFDDETIADAVIDLFAPAEPSRVETENSL